MPTGASDNHCRRSQGSGEEEFPGETAVGTRRSPCSRHDAVRRGIRTASRPTGRLLGQCRIRENEVTTRSHAVACPRRWRRQFRLEKANEWGERLSETAECLFGRLSPVGPASRLGTLSAGPLADRTRPGTVAKPELRGVPEFAVEGDSGLQCSGPRANVTVDRHHVLRSSTVRRILGRVRQSLQETRQPALSNRESRSPSNCSTRLQLLIRLRIVGALIPRTVSNQASKLLRCRPSMWLRFLVGGGMYHRLAFHAGHVWTPRPFFVLTLVASWAAGAMVWSARHVSWRQDALRAGLLNGWGRVLVWRGTRRAWLGRTRAIAGTAGRRFRGHQGVAGSRRWRTACLGHRA